MAAAGDTTSMAPAAAAASGSVGLSEVLISVRGLGKCYQIYDKPHHRLLQGIVGQRRKYFREFWALRDVGFEVRRGETFGVVGRNGSGKSTLLQLLTGTLTPTTGSVEVKGRVAALLELGAGFNPECSGRENVYMNGHLFGLTTREIDERFDAIAAFADIGDFLDQPVKTYSSGMYVRLAFAVIAHVDADVLIVDEALSVGDAFFVQKCMRFLRSFMERGTLLFVSHDTSAVVNLCSRAMLLDRGVVKMIDKPKAVTERYLEDLYADVQGDVAARPGIEGVDASPEAGGDDEDFRDARADLILNSNLRNDLEVFRFRPESSGFGTGDVAIVDVRLSNAAGAPLSWTVGDETVRLRIRAQATVPIERPIVGFLMKDKLGQIIFGDNTYLTYRNETLSVEPGGSIDAEFEFRMPVLSPGDYSFAIAVAEGTQESHVQHQWLHDAIIIRAHSSATPFGLIGVPMRRISMKVRH